MNNFKKYLEVIQESKSNDQIPGMFRSILKRYDNIKEDLDKAHYLVIGLLPLGTFSAKTGNIGDSVWAFVTANDIDSDIVSDIKNLIKKDENNKLFLNLTENTRIIDKGISETSAKSIVKALNKAGISGELKKDTITFFGQDSDHYWYMKII